MPYQTIVTLVFILFLFKAAMSVASFSQYTNLDQELDILRNELIIQTHNTYVVEGFQKWGKF